MHIDPLIRSLNAKISTILSKWKAKEVTSCSFLFAEELNNIPQSREIVLITAQILHISQSRTDMRFSEKPLFSINGNLSSRKSSSMSIPINRNVQYIEISSLTLYYKHRQTIRFYDKHTF